MVNDSPASSENIRIPWQKRRRLRDYANVGRHLLVQRVVIYSAAILLSGAYYDPVIAAIFFVAVAIFEIYDSYVFYLIVKHKRWKQKNFKSAMIAIHLGAFFSSITISLFCISLARQQGVGNGHFLPLFMLVSATIFSAMNSNQFRSVLGMRLCIYILTILFIPIRDLWMVRPPLSSDMWVNFFTIIFVLGFIMELGRNFLSGYSRDLRIREKLEEEHKRTKAALDAKTRFLATVNHELRTPLTSIKGAFDLINSGSLGQPPEKMGNLLEIASRNTNKLKDLVDDLLFLQSSDIGKIKFDFRKLDLCELVEEALERFQPHAAKMNVSVRTQYCPDDYWVCADRKRIDQVLMNLLSNAAKFSERCGTITISMDKSDDAVTLSVRDEGVGIPTNSEELVFAEFSQLDSGDGRKFQGTGLGLSISKRIIEAHDGEIRYTSQLGVGTTFSIELKRAEAPQVSHPQLSAVSA